MMPGITPYTIHSAIDTSPGGILKLLDFYAKTVAYQNRTLELDCTAVTHFDANLASVIAAIKAKCAERNNRLFVRFQGAVFGIFKRNGLISLLNGIPNDQTVVDDRESTIPLRVFLPDDGVGFTRYLKDDLFGHRGCTEITRTERLELEGHFTEVFANVIMHAETNASVFTCGQYYPRLAQIKFTIVDLGIGFPVAVREKGGMTKYTDTQAIVWALMGNSTRDVEKFGPGGNVLKEIGKYCRSKGGSLLVVSGSGYGLMEQPSGIRTGATPIFPGSIVSLTINLSR